MKYIVAVDKEKQKVIKSVQTDTFSAEDFGQATDELFTGARISNLDIVEITLSDNMDPEEMISLNFHDGKSFSVSVNNIIGEPEPEEPDLSGFPAWSAS